MQKQTNNRNEYIQAAINEANERKKELLMDYYSAQRSRNSRRSTTSSAAAQALVRAEATAAHKRLHVQKWRSLQE